MCMKRNIEKNKILINKLIIKKFNKVNGGNIDNIYKIPEHFVANEHITIFLIILLTIITMY